jgi:hypothetical protein
LKSFEILLDQCGRHDYVPPASTPETQAGSWRNGAIAQLGERYNGIVEVRGSIPLGSTISFLSCGGDFLSKTRIL